MHWTTAVTYLLVVTVVANFIITTMDRHDRMMQQLLHLSQEHDKKMDEMMEKMVEMTEKMLAKAQNHHRQVEEASTALSDMNQTLRTLTEEVKRSSQEHENTWKHFRNYAYDMLADHLKRIFCTYSPVKIGC